MKLFSCILSAIFAISLISAVAPDHCFAADKKEVSAKTQNAESSLVKGKDVKKDSKKDTKKNVPQNIDINSADAATLQLVPGIGPKTAESIVAFRETAGKFKSVEDLLSVKGIGEKSLKKMLPFLKKF